MDRNAFVEVMNEASGMLESGQAQEALARLTAFDNALLAAPEPQDYGWVVSYRFRSAFAAGDFAQALHIAENGPARFPADIPPATLATMYSMAVEAATQLGRAESAVTMADRCIDLRRSQGGPEEVLMAAMTACTLLGDIERHDLASRYAQLLITEGAGHDEHRAYGYYAICGAIEHGVGGHLVDMLRGGHDWLSGHDSEFAREALGYLENSPTVRNAASSFPPPAEFPPPVDLSPPAGFAQPVDLSPRAGFAQPVDLLPPAGFAQPVDPLPPVDFSPLLDPAQTALLQVSDTGIAAVSGPKQPPAEQLAGGETADALLEAQRPAVAAAAYRALIDEAMSTGKPDPLIVGKSVLGLLMSLIFDNQVGEAHSVWIDEQGPTYLGVWALENGQTSVHDSIAYNLVAAFLHSLSTGDRNASNHAVDTLMGRCVNWAFDKDAQVVPAMLNTWRRHLFEIHEGEPAPEYRWELTQAEQRWGGPLPESGLYWMRPYRWVVDWV
ncbi:hypothetical protein [Nocardia sp. NBC_01388]|uniref:hypothetical protein n=1 Tax=Nocardia sp. NBC_01388 TaxID=2903596 RepID=UPI00324D9EDD